jgi:hypothetical protein
MILVDTLQEYPHEPHGQRHWCHMMTDDLSAEGLQELHRMAAMLGLPRAAFQDKPGLPHYDLTPTRRRAALQHGAQAVSSKEMVTRCRRRKALPHEPV